MTDARAAVVVSVPHEVLVELFRSQTALAVELLRACEAVDLPAEVTIESIDTAFNQIVPAEYRADLVLRIADPSGKALLGVIVEPQLSVDPEKRTSWPIYLATLHRRLSCPAAVLVVTTRQRVSRWARKPIVIGPGSVMRMLVVGPESLPFVGEEEARRLPELGLLSALAHGRDEGGLEVVMAALSAIAGLDDEHAALYYDVLIASLSEGLRQELKAMVLKGKYEYQSDFARKYVRQGREEGREEGLAEGRNLGLQAAIVDVLEARHLLTEDARAKIGAQADGSVLETWLKRAVTATSVEDVFV